MSHEPKPKGYDVWAALFREHGIEHLVAVQADDREDAIMQIELLGHKVVDPDHVRRCCIVGPHDAPDFDAVNIRDVTMASGWSKRIVVTRDAQSEGGEE